MLPSFFHKRNQTKNTSHRSSRHTAAGMNHCRLALEPLESRLMLSIDPVLTVVGDQMVDEGSLLSITDLGAFTDEVVGGGGGAIGLDPGAFTSLGAFDPIANVMINTDTLAISGGFAGMGMSEPAITDGIAYEIAVFAFSDFELDAGISITATGSRPLALLSTTNLDVFGVIDVSAVGQTAGAGGGDGGTSGTLADFPGQPAAGALSINAGNAGSFTSGGGGGAYGGNGGAGFGPGSAGGTLYGDLSFGIQGGSGGGAGATSGPMDGGGGGGGIELGATGAVNVDVAGSVLANGADGAENTLAGGGGGAGGGILIHATDVTVSGVLRANGGNAGTLFDRGGGGGGGRVLLSHDVSGIFSTVGSTIETLGGTGGALGDPGGAGDFSVVPVISTSVLETYDFVINWGDGSPDDVGIPDIDVVGTPGGADNEGSFDGSHTYADAGIFTVTVTVNDSGGGLAVETTTVFVIGVGLNDGVLQVVGTNLDDRVKIFKFFGNLKVLTRLGGGPLELDVFDPANVDEIEIVLGGGDDLGIVSSSVYIDATIDGGDDNDFLVGGSGNDVLLGGAGYDVLLGRRGRDLMIGGTGSDLIIGNSGEDILIAGTTAFDNNAAALDAIMAEWTSERDYDTRVENLLGIGVGVDFDNRENGDFFLDDTTVFDDEATDWLIGGSGLDLYFANTEGGVEDHVLGLRNDEELVETIEI